MNPEPQRGVRAFESGTAPGADGRDLAHLAPGVHVPVLSLGRHQQLREHLMSEIERDGARVAAPATGAARGADAGREPAGLRGRGRLRRRFLVPAVAAVVAGAVVVTAAVIDGQPSRPSVGAAERDAATSLLDRAALAAGAAAEVPVQDWQYEYVETWGSSAKIEKVDGHYRTTLLPPGKEELWRPVTGTGELFIRTGSGGEFRSGIIAPAPGGKISGHPGYRFLEGLSTNPDMLLGQLRDLVQPNDNPPDQRVFTLIGDILRAGVMPPAFSAALFRAAAKLSGVTVVPNATDALGRPGVAVAMVVVQGSREEWIFDAESAELLGSRDVAARDNDEIAVKKGQVLGNTAILHRGIVDTQGERPPLGAVAPPHGLLPDGHRA